MRLNTARVWLTWLQPDDRGDLTSYYRRGVEGDGDDGDAGVGAPFPCARDACPCARTPFPYARGPSQGLRGLASGLVHRQGRTPRQTLRLQTRREVFSY